jgi:hypothetical protein
MLVPIVRRFPDACRWTATDRYELVRQIRVYNRAAATRLPLMLARRSMAHLRTTYAARSRLFERQKETERSIILHFRDYLQFLLRKCDEENNNDATRKGNPELVWC